MNHVKILVCVALVIFTASLAVSRGTVRDEDEKKKGKLLAEGVVVNDKGDPLAGIEVSIWVDDSDSPVESMKTEKDGHYKLHVEKETIYTIWYSHTKMNSAVVTYLSGRRNQNITKVMYLKGTKTSAAAFAFLESVDRAVYLVLAAEEEKKPRLLAKLKEKNILPVEGSKALNFEGDKTPASNFLRAKGRTINDLKILD